MNAVERLLHAPSMETVEIRVRGRVQGVFTPGSQDEGKPKGQQKKNTGGQPTN